MKNKIYVVTGGSGEWSDSAYWSVCAYYDEEKAKAHVLAASQEARLLLIEYNANVGSFSMRDYLNKYDNNMQWSYTGVFYFYDEVEIKI